jgi:hypothetical protein
MVTQFNGYLKQLQIVFGAFLSAQVLFAFAAFSLKQSPEAALPTDDIFSKVFPLAILALLVAGYILFNTRLNALNTEADFDNKKTAYRAISFIKWAMFESATFLALVLFFLFGNALFLYLGIGSIAHFALHFPSQERVMRELQTDNLS